MRLIAAVLFTSLLSACPARKSTVAEVISEVQALNDELVELRELARLSRLSHTLHTVTFERRRVTGGLTVYTPSGDADAISGTLDATESDGKPDRWSNFKKWKKAAYDAITGNKAKRAAIGVALFSIGIVFPPAEVRHTSGMFTPDRRAMQASTAEPRKLTNQHSHVLFGVPVMQAAAAAVAIGYGAYQLATKIRDKAKTLEPDDSLSKTWVIKEVAITVAATTITFLTGGLADAVPDLFGFAEDLSKLVCDQTHIAEANGVHFGENAQNINVGSVADIAGLIRDLREKKNVPTSVRNVGTIDEVLAKDPLKVGELLSSGGAVTAVQPPTDGQNNGFVLIGAPDQVLQI